MDSDSMNNFAPVTSCDATPARTLSVRVWFKSSSRRARIICANDAARLAADPLESTIQMIITQRSIPVGIQPTNKQLAWPGPRGQPRFVYAEPLLVPTPFTAAR